MRELGPCQSPEQLHGGERTFAVRDSTNESDDDSDHVDSELKLQELGDTVENVAAPLHSLQQGYMNV